jgi:hypothetical protein
MLQVVYISTARAIEEVLPDILKSSQRNNRRDGVTGLLFGNGTRFLQVLEGEPDKVDAVMARISRDPRHRSIVMLSRRTVVAREFGHWSMAERGTDEAGADFLRRIGVLVAGASPSVRATFESMAALKRAA